MIRIEFHTLVSIFEAAVQDKAYVDRKYETARDNLYAAIDELLPLDRGSSGTGKSWG